MLPDPLHPAVVHFPLVFMMVLPVVGAGAVWAMRRGTPARRAWAVPALLAAALALSAWGAVRTGEAQEERVEDVVAAAPFAAHEAAAERFLALAAIVLLVTGAGFAPGATGRAARGLAVVGAIGLVAIGVQAGHTGGQLVYRHGAASAYAPVPRGAPDAAADRARARDHDDAERERR